MRRKKEKYKVRWDRQKRNDTSNLSQKQIEEIHRKNEMMKISLEENMGHLCKEMAEERGKMQKEIDIMFVKIQGLEEEKARQNALWTKADKRIKDLETTQKSLESLIEKQQGDILKLEHEAANRELY